LTALGTRQRFCYHKIGNQDYNLQRMNIRQHLRRGILLRPLIVSLAFCGLLLAAELKLPFGGWTRASQTPILSPQGDGWESAGVFNPAVVMHDGKIVMLYRSQDTHGTSRLGYAESIDGIHFTRRPEPVLSPEADYERNGGVEDPRLVKFGDTYYLTYTGYNTKDAQLCLATSHDLIHWDRKGVILPAYKGNWNTGWTKSGAIVPEKKEATGIKCEKCGSDMIIKSSRRGPFLACSGYPKCRNAMSFVRDESGKIVPKPRAESQITVDEKCDKCGAPMAIGLLTSPRIPPPPAPSATAGMPLWTLR